MKNKAVLITILAALAGTGLGTLIGYGAWGQEKEEVKTSEPSVVVPDDSGSEESTAPEISVKGLNHVRRASATPDLSALTFPDRAPDQEHAVAFDIANGDDSIIFDENIVPRYVSKEGVVVIDFFYDYGQGTSYPDNGGKINLRMDVQDNSYYPQAYVYTYNSTTHKWSYSYEYNNQDYDSMLEIADGESVRVVLQDSDLYPYDENYLNWLCPEFTEEFFGTLSYSLERVPELFEYDDMILDGQTKDLFIDVNQNYSKDTIINSISAKDLFGKDVPVTIIEGEESFTPQTIGVYTLKVRATDDYGQIATATLIVHIVDYDPPVISQAQQFNFVADKGQNLSYTDLPTYISVTDNGTGHGSNLTITYIYDGTQLNTSWTKTFTASDYGTHKLKVKAVDSSGNTSEKEFTINVGDGTAPVITRRDGQAVGSKITIGVSKTFNMQLSDILQMFKAQDNVDGDVSSSLAGNTQADTDFFSTNHHVGTYEITIKATDRNNNATTQKLPIEIAADLPPVFIISDTLVYTDTANPLNTDSISRIVTKSLLKGKNLTGLSVDASEYIGNETTPGTYHITYDYTEASVVKGLKRANSSPVKSGAFDIVVTQAEESTEPEEKKNGFVLFFEKLGNWFKGVFTKFKFDCFITNEEWNARFPKAEK